MWSNDEIAEFWTHSSTRSVGSVPTNGPVIPPVRGPIGPPVGGPEGPPVGGPEGSVPTNGPVGPPVGAARKSGPFYRNPNRYKPYRKRNYKK